MEDKEREEQLKKLVKENADKIGVSQIFTALFTENFIEEVYPMMQLTIALMLDKPIYLLVEEGNMPTPKILRICDGWEFFRRDDPKSLETATLRLIDAAKLKGHWKEKK